MCGLFFVVERARAVDPARARQASSSLRHRGPDGIGEYSFAQTYQTTEGSVVVSGFVGHTRLSILDPSTRSRQPFRRGEQTLAYNGEIYNFRALRDELSRNGVRFETDGDTEVLLALVASKGVEALNEANGMWAFCLLDENTGQLTAARDRYGKKPLFYYADAATLCVASEISPILAYLGRRPGFIRADLDSFLRDGWLFPHSSGETHIHGIRQVVAGGALTFDLRAWRMDERCYFDLAQYSAASPPDSAQLAAIVEDAVLARLVADRKVGLLLSGGVDSSLLLSVLCARGMADRVTCFIGEAGKSDDALYAKLCVEQLGVNAVNLPLDYGATGMDKFLQVCRQQEKPFPFIGNALAMPQLYARIATYDVPVVLDGTGGDEIFAGYWDRYYRFALAQALAEGNHRWITESLAANADSPKVNAIARRALRDAQSKLGNRTRADGILRATEDPPDLDTFVDPAVRRARRSDPLESFTGTLAQALVTDAAHGRLHEWLWQNDRNAMTFGIENRSPLLDYRLASYVHSGYRQKFVGAWNKHELRTLFKVFLPLPTQWRRDKQGFRWVYSWFLRNNRDQVLDLIASSRILPNRVDVGRMLDAARKDDTYLGCGLLQRMLCVAGLEESMGIGEAGIDRQLLAA
jgi:asparagine synthase (glutamine-hydrolysing)